MLPYDRNKQPIMPRGREVEINVRTQLNSLSNSKNLIFNIHVSCSVEAGTITGLFIILCLLYQTPCGAAAKGQAKGCQNSTRS